MGLVRHALSEIPVWQDSLPLVRAYGSTAVDSYGRPWRMAAPIAKREVARYCEVSFNPFVAL